MILEQMDDEGIIPLSLTKSYTLYLTDMSELLLVLESYTVEATREKYLAFIENFNNSLTDADVRES